MPNGTQSWLTARWVAVLFLLWNFAGIGAFASERMMDLAALARTDPYQAKAFAEMPGWAWTVYGIAVLAGTLSAVFLILRNKFAVPLAAVEIIGVLAQFGYTFFGTDLLAHKSVAETVPFPAVIILIAILQFLYARWLAGKGLLS